MIHIASVFQPLEDDKNNTTLQSQQDMTDIDCNNLNLILQTSEETIGILQRKFRNLNTWLPV
jgi:hypothetical protein